jgi:ABC-type branched-subunit amino acid transport system substrate-binding protein
MNIAKALKEKNRIAGKISKLQSQLEKYNRQQVTSDAPDFDPEVIFKELQEEWAHLINLKTKIAIANLGVAERLIKLTEAKAELQYWNRFVSYAGKREETVEQRKVVNGQYADIQVPYMSYITSKETQGHIDRVQKLIEDLQDEIDTYNGVTNI